MVLIVSVLIGIALDLACSKPAVQHYASKYDHINVETILNNRRMVNFYAACLLSTGPCPPEGIEFKRILPEALHTNCGRCSEKQSTIALRAIKRLKKEYPKVWSQLSSKWDPEDIYIRKFESTFGFQNSSPSVASSVDPSAVPSVVPSVDSSIVNRFGFGDDHPTDNDIEGVLSHTTTTIQLNPSPINHDGSTTHNVITSTNSNPSFSIHTSTKTDEQTSPSTSPTTSRISTSSPSGVRPSISTPTSSTSRLPPISGLLPLNTFFTNPPIPIRPIVNLNIGANIGATVSGLVRSIGAIGSRVMDTGIEIADVVIKNFARPLRF